MTTSADQADTKKTPTEEPPPRKPGSAQPMKAVIGLVGIIITIAVVGTAFQAMQIYDMPRVLQVITNVLPARHFVHGLRAVMLRGAPLEHVLADLAKMAIFAAVVVLLCVVKFGRKVR